MRKTIRNFGEKRWIDFQKWRPLLPFGAVLLYRQLFYASEPSPRQRQTRRPPLKSKNKTFKEARRWKAHLLRKRDAESRGRCGTICTKHNRRKKTSGSVKKQRPVTLSFPLSINSPCQQFSPWVKPSFNLYTILWRCNKKPMNEFNGIADTMLIPMAARNMDWSLPYKCDNTYPCAV